MNSQYWETPDCPTMRWSGNDPYQPIYSPYVHETGNPFEGEVGNPPLWNQHCVGTQVCNSFDGAVPSPGVNGVIWRTELEPPRPPGVHSSPPMDSSNTYRGVSDEEEQEDERYSIPEDLKTVLEVPRRNSFKPTWKCSKEDETLDSAASSPHTTKRQKLSKASNGDNQSSHVHIEKSRRRSQRKPSLTIKTTQPHAEISTEPSSPDMETSTDSQDHSAAVKTKKSHNLTEKKYRNRLNGYFDNLLSAIPRTPGVLDWEGNISHFPEKKVSKGEVLVLALGHIRALEKQMEILQEENKALVDDLERLKGICGSSRGK